jgi:glycolate oxidase iron-sulfur subunit
MTSSFDVGRSTLDVQRSDSSASPSVLLRELDYSVVQQCMHCGMCLPTCPTYDATKEEKNSPRGRIALMRAIADGKLEPTKAFADEMYFCLGCLACETACPAGVDYTQLFETARADAERSGVLQGTQRDTIRLMILRGLFTRPRLLRWVGRLVWLYRATGAQGIFRALRLNRLLPYRFRELERMTPKAQAKFSHQLIRPLECPTGQVRYRVGMLTGCVQDLVLSDVNRDTVDVLLANGCEVHTPAVQDCCGSLHAHNGEVELARELARRQLRAFDLEGLDAIITNAAGCGSHLKHYDHLLHDDPEYAERAKVWSAKLKDIHEWLCEINFRHPVNNPQTPVTKLSVTYHEACHLCHGQKITRQPREILRAIPGLELTELSESTWCCGSAGIYNITQPEMAANLQERKMGHIADTKAPVVATANPGCHLQLESGSAKFSTDVSVRHPVSLLAAAYREGKDI